MSQLIESLEQRKLMSASAITLNADRLNLNADATTAAIAGGTRQQGINDAVTALAGDVKLVDTTTNRVANNKLIAKLRSTAAIDYARVLVAQNIFLGVARAYANAGFAHGAVLIKHPTNVAYQKLVTKDIANLTTGNIVTRLNNFEAALATANMQISAAADAVAAANPSVQGTDTNGETNLATNSAAASAAETMVQTDASQLATDLATLLGG